MANKNQILAICGSTKQTSINLILLQAIAELCAGRLALDIFTAIDRIPHFNPDLDTDTPPDAVRDFRARLGAADGVLICTPEYAMGVPGTLKNALDWTVSSCEFSKKPTALITASSQGFKGHAALLETLRIIEAGITDDTQLLISFVKTKINPDGSFRDPDTKTRVLEVMAGLESLVEAG